MRRDFGSATRGTAFTLTACGLLLISANGFAVGGACPSGANYVNSSNPTGALVPLSHYGITSCYFIAANGSDSNTGACEVASGGCTGPWSHAPGMSTCTGTCASVTPTAGEGFIFRGGDTWHMGNSGASPYTGGAWFFTNNGNSSNQIYFGVDSTWYTGNSWARPIFTGDNPTSTSTTLTSCPYQIAPSSGGSSNTMLSMYSIAYNIVDNFELTGLCESDLNGSETDTYIRYGSAYAMTFLNLYIHGWTHVQFGNPSNPVECTPTTVCFNIHGFQGGGEPLVPDDTVLFTVIDGSDSDPLAMMACYCDWWNVGYSYIGNQSDVVVRYPHLFHDNLYEYWYENGHGNVVESVGDPTGTNANYNNVYRHINVPNAAGDPLIWLNPQVGYTDYFFNNLSYDIGSMEIFNVGQNDGNQGTMAVFNNTWQINSNSGNGSIFGCTGVYSEPLVAANNHYIIDTAAYGSGCMAGLTATTNLLMSNATATADGYMTSETYAESPTSPSSPTVGAGTNEGTLNGAFCSALSTAAVSDPTLSDAATACLSDTRYACTYNSGNHTVTCPARTAVARPSSGAWHVGAYQYGGSPAPAPPIVSPPAAH